MLRARVILCKVLERRMLEKVRSKRLGSFGSLAEANEEIDEAHGSLLKNGYHVNVYAMCHAQHRDWPTGDRDSGLYWYINGERRMGT
jgi:hypothetical protein